VPVPRNVIVKIGHVLFFLAGAECFLLCALSLALSFGWPFSPPLFSRQSKRVPTDSWGFVFILKVIALSGLGLFTLFNWYRHVDGTAQEQLWATLAAMVLAIFISLEVFAAWKTWRAARVHGGKWRFLVCLASYAMSMEILSVCALYGLCDHQGSRRDYGIIQPFDPVYVYAALSTVMLLCGVLSRAVCACARLTRPVICLLFLFLFGFAGYAAALPLHGKYLVFMLSNENIPENGNSRWTHFAALWPLVPYLSTSTFEDLPLKTWAGVTCQHERPGDPLYMAQLRRAAPVWTGGYMALPRLWTLKPAEARDIAEEVLNKGKYKHYVDYASVLFLEDPDRGVFKEFIPDDAVRRELSEFLFRWTTAAMPRAAKECPALPNVIHNRLYVGFSHLCLELTYGCAESKRWFVSDNIKMPEHLIPAFLNLLIFTRDDYAYLLMSTPNQKHAVLTMRTLLELERRAKDPKWMFRIHDFLGHVHRDVAVACMRELVQAYGELGVLQRWSGHPFLDSPRCTELGEIILDRWNEVVPDAPTLGGARGKPALDAFIAARKAQL
jgi:hypothetical protein